MRCLARRGRYFNPRHPRGWRRKYYSEVWTRRNFNPRHPRGWRQLIDQRLTLLYLFQSTPPAWVATFQSNHHIGFHFLFQSTPPAWVATKCGTQHRAINEFQSTPPAWVATECLKVIKAWGYISIHATRVGGDLWREREIWRDLLFQSTPPAWVATSKWGIMSIEMQFQSTPPAWVATAIICYCLYINTISIHATRVGGDSLCASLFTFCSNFNPRHPRGWRP